MRIRFASILLLSLATACGDADYRASSEEATASEGGGFEGRGAADGEALGRQEVAQAPPSDAAAPQPAAPAEPGATVPSAAAADTSAPIPTMIIRTGRAVIQVDSLEPAIARVQRLAASLGGYVANTGIQSGGAEVREATLELKIPAARFDQATAGLRPIGRLESLTAQAQDVGEEYVDVSARVANSRRLEERLIQLLAARTGNLEQVLAVERELARVREEIERSEGRLRYLRTRAAMSTLTVNLHEPRPVVGDYPGQSPIRNAFREAWRNFIGFVAGFIESLGVLVPLLVIGFVLWWLVRWWRRRGSA